MSFSISEIATLAPPEQIPVWKWVEKHRVLNRRSSAEIGPKRVSRTPALKIIYDWFEDPHIREVVIQKPAQIGLTDLVVDLILWVAVNDPSPTALFLADQDTARKIMKFRIDPALREMGLVKHASAAKSQDVTKFEVTLRNGFYLAVAWGSSVAQTASMAFKRIFCDEINKPGYELVKTEGSTLGRIRERMETFEDSKFFALSTPTEEDGRVTKELKACDVIYDYAVPCHACGAEQALTFKQVEWDGGKEATRKQVEATAHYKCSHCGASWTDSQRKTAISRGQPAPRTVVENPRKIGYQLHRLASLFKGGVMSEIVLRWNQAQGDPQELQNVVNSVFGEPWVSTVGPTSTEEVLATRLPDLKRHEIPKEAAVLVAFVDVQMDSFWYRIRAFAPDRASWGIDEGQAITWKDVENLLFNSKFKRHNGVEMGIWRAGIDIGGGKAEGELISRSEETMIWAQKNRFRLPGHVFACKGASHAQTTPVKVGAWIDKNRKGEKIPGGRQINTISTDFFKENFFRRMEWARTGEPGGAYLHSETEIWYCNQILAERKERRRDGTVEWVQKRPDNHMLDCEVGCFALVDNSFYGGIRRLEIQNALPAPEEPPKKPAPPAENPFAKLPQPGTNPYTRR